MFNTLTKRFIALIIFSGIGFSAAVNADVDTQNLVAGYGVPMAKKYLWVAPYDITQLMASGGVLGQLFTPALSEPIDKLLLPHIAKIFTNVDRNAGIEMLSKIPAPLFPLTTQANASVFVGQTSPSIDPKQLAEAEKISSSYDINSLVGPLRYENTNNSNQSQIAQDFITMVSGLGNPLRVVNFAKLNYNADQLNFLYQTHPEIVTYLLNLRAYNAQLSVGLNNLFHLYNERASVADNTPLGQQLDAAATLPTGSKLKPPTKPLSVLQVRHLVATRRIADPDWYGKMQKASPAEIQRQMLFLLAEMRAEMFHTNMEIERLNTTMTVILLQNTEAKRAILQGEQSSIENATPFINTNPTK